MLEVVVVLIGGGIMGLLKSGKVGGVWSLNNWWGKWSERYCGDIVSLIELFVVYVYL